MVLDQREFITFVKKMIQSSRVANTTEKEKEYVRLKCRQLIDLLIELENKNLIKDLSSNYLQVESEINNCLQNVADLNKFRADLTGLLGKRPSTGSTEVTLKDNLSNALGISMNQYVVFCGVTYAALCEFMKFVLMRIINFDSMHKSDTSGIGAIKTTLVNVGVTKLDFFEHVDNKLRNTFFHMDFRITNEDGGRIYCSFDDKIYTSEYWKALGSRSNKDNLQKEYITITDLIWQDILADLSIFSLIGSAIYAINKIFKGQSPRL